MGCKTAQLKKKLIMQSINFFVYIFFFCMFLQQVASDNTTSFHHQSHSKSNGNISYRDQLQKLGKDFKEGIVDSTAKVKNLYHDTSTKAYQLSDTIKISLSQEIDYIQKDIVPTCLGIPYYYYGGFLLLCYASQHSLTYNLQMVGGVIISLGLFGNFIKWSVYRYNKMYFEKQSKK